MKNKNLIILCIIIICSFLSSFPFQNMPIFDYTAYAKTLRCSKCGKKISGQFLKNTKGQLFCSKRCFSKTLPKCSVCRRPSKMTNGKKYFCSQKCLKSTWPVCRNCKRSVKGGILRGLDKKFLCKRCADKPKCFSCYMPANFARFADGRYICKTCNKTSISDPGKLKRISEEVRKLMKDKLHLSTDHGIDYRVVSLSELQGKTSHKHQGIELGLFKFEQLVEKTTTTNTFLGKTSTKTEERIKHESHTIYFLYGIPENKLREVAAHELAHDWMQEYYPDITDLKIKEGWAEYVASLINNIYGRSKMNRRMRKNSDLIYGDGYRMIKKIAEQDDPNAIFKMFENAK
jgi:hypothetical protein